ncbi:MAG TPA: hypothetical protein VG844_03190 [Terracidiphilus sp.]|nr:hypothetical protein [Terracidiphilus sp.]
MTCRQIAFRSFVSLMLACPLAVHGYAQAPNASQAPIPSALRTAKTIFVSNAGADSGLFPEPFTGGTSRAYDYFYERLQASKLFTLVDHPSKADLVLELALAAPNGPSNDNKQHGTADPLPMFRLTIYDQPSHYILWTETESIDDAIKQKTHDRNFDEALDRLAQDFLADTGHGNPPPPRDRMSHKPF